MITLIQRVLHASVLVDDHEVAAIERGLLLFVGVEHGDQPADADTTARKLAQLRCFPGRTPMDLTVAQAAGSCLVVSQFTLAAELAHGNRPSFTAAAAPDVAEPLYLRVADQLRLHGLVAKTGVFGAKMLVPLGNDGPVTFTLRVRGGRVIARDVAPPTTTA